jgi:hypothetical protein
MTGEPTLAAKPPSAVVRPCRLTCYTWASPEVMAEGYWRSDRKKTAALASSDSCVRRRNVAAFATDANSNQQCIAAMRPSLATGRDAKRMFACQRCRIGRRFRAIAPRGSLLPDETFDGGTMFKCARRSQTKTLRRPPGITLELTGTQHSRRSRSLLVRFRVERLVRPHLAAAYRFSSRGSTSVPSKSTTAMK